MVVQLGLLMALAAPGERGSAPPPLPPGVISALREGAKCLSERKWAEALNAFERAAAGAPGNVPLRVSMAIRLLQLNRRELNRTAYRFLREAAELDPSNYVANRILGDWYFKRDFFRESTDRYKRALKRRPRDPRVLNNLAISLDGLKRFPEAVETAKKAVEYSGGKGRYRVGLAWVYVDWRKADKALETLKNVDSNKLKGYDRNLFYRVRAQARFLAGKTEGALEDLKFLTRIAPRYVKGYQLLGLYYQRLERYEEAEKGFRKVLSLDPDNEEAHYGLGLVCLRLKKRAESRKHLAAYRKLARERQERRLRELKEMSEELKDRQKRGWIPGM